MNETIAMKIKERIIDSFISLLIFRNAVITAIIIEDKYKTKNPFLPPPISSLHALANKYPAGKAKIIIKIDNKAVNIIYLNNLYFKAL